MDLMGVLKLTQSSYLPGLSAGPHSYDADCGVDATVAAVEAVVRGGSGLDWQSLRLGWGSGMLGEVLEANLARPRESWSQDWVCSSCPHVLCVARLALEQQCEALKWYIRNEKV
jgi:hypothetical protein